MSQTTLHLPKKQMVISPEVVAAAIAATAPVPAVLAPKPVQKKELITLRSGIKFVVIFGCSRKSVPEGIQVSAAGEGGVAGVVHQASKEARFSKVKFDLDDLLTRCIVDNINVREHTGEYCRVYVNCTIGIAGKMGLYFWKGVTGEFARKELSQVWSRAILRTKEGRTELELRKVVGGRPETRIRFAIES